MYLRYQDDDQENVQPYNMSVNKTKIVKKKKEEKSTIEIIGLLLCMMYLRDYLQENGFFDKSIGELSLMCIGLIIFINCVERLRKWILK